MSDLDEMLRKRNALIDAQLSDSKKFWIRHSALIVTVIGLLGVLVPGFFAFQQWKQLSAEMQDTNEQLLEQAIKENALTAFLVADYKYDVMENRKDTMSLKLDSAARREYDLKENLRLEALTKQQLLADYEAYKERAAMLVGGLQRRIDELESNQRIPDFDSVMFRVMVDPQVKLLAERVDMMLHQCGLPPIREQRMPEVHVMLHAKTSTQLELEFARYNLRECSARNARLVLAGQVER